MTPELKNLKNAMPNPKNFASHSYDHLNTKKPTLDQAKIGYHFKETISCSTPCNQCCKAFGTIALKIHEYEFIKPLVDKKYLSIMFGLKLLNIKNGCPLLIDNECSIYDNRPSICKTYMCDFQMDKLKNTTNY